MIATFTALLLAHVLADFVFQTDWMVANKHRPAAFAAHGAVVLATTVATLGSITPAILAPVLAHLGIDAVKTWHGRRGLGPFMLDQAAHLSTIAATAWVWPDLWPAGIWSGLTALPSLMVLVAGLVLAMRAGGFAVGLLMEPWAEVAKQHGGGLPNAGRVIGLLERGLIFLMVLSGMPEAIGFLIAAKSVLRFGTLGDDRAFSEYVIVGTLASFGWALATSYLTSIMLGLLPPLGFPDLAP